MDVKIDISLFLLIGNILFSKNRELQKQASDIAKSAYLEKYKAFELRNFYTTDKSEYLRIRNMSDSEYADRLEQIFAFSDQKTDA